MASAPHDAFRIVRLEENHDGAVPRLTGRGAALLVAGLMLIIAGLLTRDGDLVAMGVGTVLLMVPMAGLAWWNLQRISLAADLPDKVIAEERFDCRLRVANGRPLGDAFQVFAEQQLPGILRFHAPWTPAQEETEVLLDGSVPRRGIFGGGQVFLRSTFPLGLFKVLARGHMTDSMLVMPRPLVPAALEDPCLSVESDDLRVEQTRWPSLGELHGLRAYQPGDPLRLIHWPASSRGQGLVTRTYDRPRYQPKLAVLVFHSASSDRTLIRPENFEAALRLLAGTIWRLAQQDIPVEVRADFLDWRPFRCANRDECGQFHASLAKVKRANKTNMDKVDELVRAAPNDAIIIVISDLPRSGWEAPCRRAAGKRRFHAFDPTHSGQAKAAKIPRKRGLPA
jgi:uncharacterized protein (DUF58 family)